MSAICSSRVTLWTKTYDLCRALYDNAAALAEEHELFIGLSDPLFLCDEPPVPLHDGARRCYAEPGPAAAE